VLVWAIRLAAPGCELLAPGRRRASGWPAPPPARQGRHRGAERVGIDDLDGEDAHVSGACQAEHPCPRASVSPMPRNAARRQDAVRSRESISWIVPARFPGLDGIDEHDAFAIRDLVEQRQSHLGW